MIAMIMNNLTILILIVHQRSREHSTTFETERRNKRSLDGQPPRARFQHKGDWVDVGINKNPQKLSIEDKSITKESLAAQPIKYVLKDSQRYLSIGYDLNL